MIHLPKRAECLVQQMLSWVVIPERSELLLVLDGCSKQFPRAIQKTFIACATEHPGERLYRTPHSQPGICSEGSLAAL